MIRTLGCARGRFGVRLAAGLLAAAFLTLAPALAFSADAISYRSGGTGSAINVTGTILRVQNGNLQWQSNSGTNQEKPLDSIVKVKSEGEAALNEAEDAFEAGKWDLAATAYEKAATSSKKEWVKDRSAYRLVAAAEKAGNFGTSAKAFVQIAIRDPANADKYKPVIPNDKAQVVAAIPAVERGFATKQSDLLRGFLGELYIANGEAGKAATLLGSAPATGGPKNPVIIITQAKASVASGNFAGAIEAIEANRAIFTMPDQQLDALYTIAEAKAKLAGTDAAKRQDAAIAYMRVVAHFGAGKSPLILDSLMKTGALLEQAGQDAEALAVYQQVTTDARFKDTPAGGDAKKKVDELAKKLKGAR